VTHLLDTDHITFLQRQDGREWAVIVAHVTRVGQRNVGLSILSFHEQVIGIHAELNKARKPADLPRWYRRMFELFDLYAKSNLIVFDDAAAGVLEVLRKTPKLRLDPMDLRLAAIALAHHLTLVTRNVADFARVPNLKTEDWTR
jgi:tRNA(fMet)-specific endonuclease VapC